MRQLNQLPRRAPTWELSERGTCGSADRTSSTEGRSWRHRLFQKRREKGPISESGDGAQNTGRETAWAHLVPGASGGGVRGRALAFGKFSDSVRRALGKNVRRRGPSRVKKPAPIREARGAGAPDSSRSMLSVFIKNTNGRSHTPALVSLGLSLSVSSALRRDCLRNPSKSSKPHSGGRHRHTHQPHIIIKMYCDVLY